MPTGAISPSTSPVSPAAITLRCERVCLFMVNLLFHCELLDVNDLGGWQGSCRGWRRAGSPVSGLETPGSYCAALVNDTELSGQCSPVSAVSPSMERRSRGLATWPIWAGWHRQGHQLDVGVGFALGPALLGPIGLDP
jgi:hypothetical protein